MNEHSLSQLFLALAVILFFAKLSGELFRRIGQPPVVGEILSGIILGETVLGYIFPDIKSFLFPLSGEQNFALHILSSISIFLLMVIAGIEIDFQMLLKHGIKSSKISFLCFVITFSISFLAAYYFPDECGKSFESKKLIFALFFANLISVSALAIIARVLRDLNLIKSEFGTIVMTCAMLIELLGLIIFSIIYSISDASNNGDDSFIVYKVASCVLLLFFSLSIGRIVIDYLVGFVQKNFPWPGGILGLIITVSFLLGSLTEYLGVHAIFGAFLSGIMFGASQKLHEKSKEILDQFISNIFVPIFFCTISLHINFISYINLNLILILILLKILLKIVLYSRVAQIALDKTQSASFSLALMAGGVLEIIIATVALERQIISKDLFVSMIFVVILSAIMSGPLIKWKLNLRKKLSMNELFSPDLFCEDIKSDNKKDAIFELINMVSRKMGYSKEQMLTIAMENEIFNNCGIENGAAIPNFNYPLVKKPLIAVGRSDFGIDFDTLDGMPVHWIFLVITSPERPNDQIQIIANISDIFYQKNNFHKIRVIDTFHEFMEFINKTQTDSGENNVI